MKSVWNVLKEQISSLYLIQRLAMYELKTDNSGNYLGVLWEILNPMIQIGIYWFVFGYGMFHGSGHTGRHEVGGIPYFSWMLAGISVWFFVNQSILLGSKSIYTRIGFISKMSFPMSVIPTYVIVAKYYQHIIIVFIVMVILSFNGYPPTIYYLQLPYFMLATVILMISISLISSTLSTIIRDVHLAIASVVRMLIYLSPFLWAPSKSLQVFMKYNPLYYIAEGYRHALLGESWYLVQHDKYTLYFWVLTLVLFSIGSVLHVKFRSHFVDYL